MARFTTLAAWLSWQETLHPNAIDLGLERVTAVLQRLGWQGAPWPVISVAGTNGKGSCVALLAAILQAQGYQVGCFTSPHLLRYNERINLQGQAVSDAALCAAFAQIDAARGAISLTYFEFNTLAALLIFQTAPLDVVVLEVGLGGRLDAVNAVDADLAFFATLDLDHQAWLGETRELIAQEKAGILRLGKPAVCADPDPPLSLRAAATQLAVPLAVLGQSFSATVADNTWCWQTEDAVLVDLPLPALPGNYQISNAAAVLAALHALRLRLPVTPAAVAQGLRQVRLLGRWQCVRDRVWLDVAHNPQAARSLAALLQVSQVAGQTLAVVGIMRDKDWSAVLAPLLPWVTAWYAVDLPTPRALAATELAAWLQAAGATVSVWAEAEAACAAAYAVSHAQGRVIVFGSFFTVAAALHWADTASI